YQAAVLKSIYQGTQERGAQLSGPARQWSEALVRKLLASHSSDEGLLGAELAGALQVRAAENTLAVQAAKQTLPEAQRRAALDALITIDPKGQTQLLERLLHDASESMGLRERAVEVLAGLNQPETHAALIKVLEVAPARLQHAIANHLVN